MPNRILKETICTSETIDSLTAEEERFFYRLLVQCDDYGRMDGRPQVIRAKCFPLKVDEITNQQVTSWLQSLVRVDLIRMYEVDGRPYLQVTTWERHQQVRAKKSRYPQPPDGTCNHMISDDCRCPRESESESESESEFKNISSPAGEGVRKVAPAEKLSDGDAGSGAQQHGQAETASPKRKKGAPTVGKAAGKGDEYTPEFEAFWQEYPKKLEKRKAFRLWKIRIREGLTAEDLVAAAKNYADYCRKQNTESRYIKYPTTFLGPDKPFLDWIGGDGDGKGGVNSNAGDDKYRIPDDFYWADDRRNNG